MRLLRKGALASHYHVQWDKGFNRVTETERISYQCNQRISYQCGEGFALFFTSMKMKMKMPNSGTYRPTLTVSMICVGVHGWLSGCNMILLECTHCNIHDGLQHVPPTSIAAVHGNWSCFFSLWPGVTQDKELQIWIDLQVPLPDPVRAVVCFTSTDDEGIQRHYMS